jgi:hypothetical protein
MKPRYGASAMLNDRYGEDFDYELDAECDDGVIEFL